MKTAYEELQKRQQQELEDFPIVYAFNKQQLEDGLRKLGADISECCTVFDHGYIVKKEDAGKLLKMMERHTKELKEAMKDKQFAYDAFLYEMNNHEYAINWSGDEDVLSCFCMDFDEVEKMGLTGIYHNARRAHFKQAEEWDMI